MTAIRHRETRDVIVSGEGPVAKVLQQAVADAADLAGADLSGALLREAKLRRARLAGADLTGARLRAADLTEAHLSGAALGGADLRGANLTQADLVEATLTGARLCRARLSHAVLRHANLRGADLRSAKLKEAVLYRADLTGAYLYQADLSDANLQRADLTDANLTKANLQDAFMSWCIGLLDPVAWLADGEWTAEGLVVYSSERRACLTSDSWGWEVAAELRETAHPYPTSLQWWGLRVLKTAASCREMFPDTPVWRCLIPVKALPSIVVPYNTDGEFRCGMVVLLGLVDDEEVTS